ncbi:MAG: PKD domain-containing protein [Acidobacteriota bacterium]
MFYKPCHWLLATCAFLSSPTQAAVPFGAFTDSIRQQDRPPAVSIEPSNANRPGRPAVTVTVDKSRVRVGELVRFTLGPGSLVTNPKLNVTIDFGDGTRIETRQTQVSHRYGATGHYKVSASVVSPGFEFGTQHVSPQRPLPRVTLVAKPTSVVAGNLVSFNAQLTLNYPGIKYRFSFGDGSQTDWQEGPFTSHSYPTGGTYLAYVDLGIGYSGGVKQVGGSVRQPVVVTKPINPPTNPPANPVGPKNPPDPRNPPDPLPGSVQLTANPTPVQMGKPVTFNAQVASKKPNIRYRFVFGDGSSSGWQGSSQSTHAYRAAGNYSASVTMGLSTNSTIRRLSNAQQGIRVTKSPAVTADFAVNPIPVEQGRPVTFNAQPSSKAPNLRYRFVFGDGSSPTGWQTGPQASYSYPTAGNYAAHVEIGRWSKGRVAPMGTSNTKMITVTSSPVATASPGPTQTGGPSPSSSPTSVVPFGPISSPGSTSTPTPLGGLPTNWWIYLAIALLLTFVAYQIYRALFVPRATFHANRDTGNSEVDAGAKGLSINSQVLLRPNVSEGHYLVHSDEPNIVRSVRRENV